MKPLPQPIFDIYTLALPRGHDFGERPPIGAWQSEDGRTCGAITRDMRNGSFGILVMRRREDQLWLVLLQEHGFINAVDARIAIEDSMRARPSFEPIPANTARRPALWDLQGREPSSLFKLLTQRTHHVAAWLFNQLYLALPKPDENWTGDFQTDNFHTRMWEAHLLACFREQGMLVTQPCRSPDFQIKNRSGDVAWIEAVTANPPERYDHVNSKPTDPPESLHERFFGSAAERFAKTLRSKIQRNYHLLNHVAGNTFAIALADFHASGSMIWSREALISYLYGLHAEVIEVDGRRVASASDVHYLLGEAAIPAGLFRNNGCSELSAIIFTNSCSIAKFNRVGVSAGALTRGLRYVRIGEFYDRMPDALKGIPFCLDVTSAEYRALWPQGYEPWSAELEIFHNPYAKHPFSRLLLPEATHWFDADHVEAYYETFVLSSRTVIQNDNDPLPSLDELLSMSDQDGV
jgi:hypothetical protein